jgi:hypothetical protein
MLAPELPKVEFTLDTLGLLFAVAFPGFLSQRVYRLIMPASDVDWKDGLMSAMFYTVLNDIALFPFLRTVIVGSNAISSPGSYFASLLVLVLLGPLIWPVLYVWLSTTSRLKRWLIIPYRSAGDYFFSKRQTCFVVVHLKNGGMVGGWYGPTGYVTTYPESGDLFLSAAVRLDARGELGPVIPTSIGVLVRRDEYTHLELHTDQVLPAVDTETATAASPLQMEVTP